MYAIRNIKNKKIKLSFPNAYTYLRLPCRSKRIQDFDRSFAIKIDHISSVLKFFGWNHSHSPYYKPHLGEVSQKPFIALKQSHRINPTTGNIKIKSKITSIKGLV